MVKLIKQFSIKAFCLVLILLLSSLFISENVFSQKYWKRDFTKVTYDPVENSILIRFEVFDYYFEPGYVNAFLKICDFDFTTDGQSYTRLMRAHTSSQRLLGCTKLKMVCKKPGTELQFLGCCKPPNASSWTDANKTHIAVEVKNEISGQVSFESNNKKIKIDKYIAFFTVKWLLGEEYKNVTRIRLNGIWKVYRQKADEIKDVYYDIPSRKMLKSTVNQSENDRVKVTRKADAIVITGAENGENIKVYNTEGIAVQSTVTKGDVVNIKLPKNQIYIVNIGQARYKVVM